MGSLTKTVKKIRSNKLTKSGKTRKRVMRRGSTPRFSVHLEEGESALPQAPKSDPIEQI